VSAKFCVTSKNIPDEASVSFPHSGDGINYKPSRKLDAKPVANSPPWRAYLSADKVAAATRNTTERACTIRPQPGWVIFKLLCCNPLYTDFIPYEKYLIPYANRLRKSMTYSERILWKRIKGKQMLGYDFHRQKPILKYIVDFFCKELMLVIEVDGITHFDDGKDALARQMEIESLGLHFFRIQAIDIIQESEKVLKALEEWIYAWEEKNGMVRK
jgi:very-short-patch-repair endonuclease